MLHLRNRYFFKETYRIGLKDINCYLRFFFIECATRRNDYDACKCLVEAGIDVNNHYTDEAPLFIAAEEGSVDLVRLLIKGGADINWANKEGT